LGRLLARLDNRTLTVGGHELFALICGEINIFHGRDHAVFLDADAAATIAAATRAAALTRIDDGICRDRHANLVSKPDSTDTLDQPVSPSDQTYASRAAATQPTHNSADIHRALLRAVQGMDEVR
jgi:hypothetical protein